MNNICNGCVSIINLPFSRHVLRIGIVMWHWLMFYIDSYSYYTLYGWLLMELCWSALTWTQDWLSSPVPNMPCFHFFPHLGFFFQANITDKLFITLSISFWLQREKGLQKWNMAETYHNWKPFFFHAYWSHEKVCCQKEQVEEKRFIPDDCMLPNN